MTDIRSAVEYFGASRIFSRSRFMSRYDAAVLYAAQQGLAAARKNQPIASNDESGARHWASFFAEMNRGTLTPHELKTLRLQAEQGGVDWAMGVVTREGTRFTSSQEHRLFFTFLAAANQYRSGVANHPGVPIGPRNAEGLVTFGTRLAELALTVNVPIDVIALFPGG